MRQTEKHTQPVSRYGKPTRILALLLSLLVSGGAVTYIVWLLIDLFSK